MQLTEQHITPGSTGYYKLDVDVPALTYTMTARMIGLVGSATPNGWDSPDQKMDYDQQTGTWSITVDLVVGEFKFRLNDGWAWNLGGTPASLVHDGPNFLSPKPETILLPSQLPTLPVRKANFTIVKN